MYSGRVTRVGWFCDSPPLVEVDEEDQVIPEDGNPVSRWHDDEECKHIINKCIKCLQVGEREREGEGEGEGEEGEGRRGRDGGREGGREGQEGGGGIL